jgi:hypothetical protein
MNEATGLLKKVVNEEPQSWASYMSDIMKSIDQVKTALVGFEGNIRHYGPDVARVSSECQKIKNYLIEASKKFD